MKPGKFKLKIAVTGGAGSGKSEVCRFFSEFGLEVISADELARRAVCPGTSAYKKIIEKFGKGVMQEDGSLNRKKLRRMITSDPAGKKALEDILHPEIIRVMMQRMAEAQKAGKSVVVEVPLLFELNLENDFDVVVAVCAKEEIRIARLMARDNVSREAAKELIRIQMPEREKEKGSDFVIRNEGSLEQLKKDARLVCKQILMEMQAGYGSFSEKEKGL